MSPKDDIPYQDEDNEFGHLLITEEDRERAREWIKAWAREEKESLKAHMARQKVRQKCPNCYKGKYMYYGHLREAVGWTECEVHRGK